MSREQLVKILKFGIVLMLIVYPPMIYFFTQSGYDSSRIMADQLSFNDYVLFEIYTQLILSGNLDYYRWGQILDYGYMISYGAVFFSLCVLTGRIFDKEKFPKAEQMGNLFGFLAIIAAVCDMIENAFILLTLANPLTFPPIYAIIHSVFALIKWILLILIILYIIIGRINHAIKK
jgi:hypothetical protein